MSMARQIARFSIRASDRDLSDEARSALKARILDAIGCAFGALGGGPIPWLRAQVDDFGGRPLCSLIGGGRSSPDRAAFYNGALVRYLDFNDSYLAPRETCHPSDNLAAVLAASEYAKASGRTLLSALAVAYQIQCRLSDVAPVRDKGFDHTTQGACAVAAAVSKALGLDEEQTTNAIAIATTELNALRVTRTGTISHWKGLAYPHMAFAATHAAFLAARGITGPELAFEGNKGLIDTITGPFSIDWSREDLERVRWTAVKRYDGEIHAQSAIEAMLELVIENDISADDIERIEADTFDVAYRIIGGGEEGDKTKVETREQADHSLPFMLAVVALDRELTPAEYSLERLQRNDVQHLLRLVSIKPDPALSARFPKECPARIRIILKSGRVFEREKPDYLGYPTRSMPWSDIRKKFDRLSAPHIDSQQRLRIADAVSNIEDIDAAELGEALLGGIRLAPRPEPLTEEIQP